MTSREFLADVLLLIVAVIWGSTFTIVKQAVESTPVFSFLFMRFFLAGSLLVILSLTKIRSINTRVLKDGTILGVALFMAYAFQTFGLTTTSAAVTAFITGLYVVMVPILSSTVLRKMPRREALIGVILSAAGLALITLQGRLFFTFGEILVFLCAVCCAFHIILTDTFTRRNDVTLLTMVQIGVVAVLAMTSSFIFDPVTVPREPDNQLIIALVVTAVFATVMAFGIQMSMQKHTSPTKTAIIFSMEPVSAAFFSYWFAGEILTGRQYVGALMILSAMIVAEVGSYVRSRREVRFV